MGDVFLFLLILAILATPILGVILVIRAVMKKPIKGIAIGLACCVIAIIPLALLGLLPNVVYRGEHETEITDEVTTTYTENIETVEETDTDAPVVVTSDWKTVFSANGFVEDEISDYEEILTNVGITDYHDVEVIENGSMHIVRGKIYNSDVLQLNMTLENRKIVVVTLAGIPDYETDAYINWRGKLKFKKQQTTRSIDLYYDVEGGYVAKLDWENMLITPYVEETE